MKITYKTLLDFERKYYLGVYDSQRLGQAFCNVFFIQGDQELFYCDNKRANEIIKSKYVDYSK